MEGLTDFIKCMKNWWCNLRRYEYTTSSSQLVPFQNVSIEIPEWEDREVTFTGGIGVALFSKPFISEKVRQGNPDVSVSSELFVDRIEGWVNIVVYPQLVINLPPNIPSGQILITMPVPVPPLMTPRENRSIIIFDRETNFDPFGFEPSALVPFDRASVVVDNFGIVHLIIDFINTGDQEITIVSTQQFVLEYKL